MDNPTDLSELSIRMMGVGTDRVKNTIRISKGLSPSGEVPPFLFPQANMKSGKTPRVSKGIVHDLHTASIGEVVFTDTFETADDKYRYGQAFVCYRSRFGDVIPIRSRKRVGWSFTEFCARHFTPLILIRDNISENTGGSLQEECLARSVRSAFSCPYTPQQDYAEGYLGRVTSMASFGMVFSGAPLHMWVWSIQCAVFVNNVTASYYSKENVWATPYQLIYGEPFPDTSILVPFGCGALVLLQKEEQQKFRTRCALMIFVHYATDHPLYTYAFYSPRTHRILYRQDCLFLPTVFPMRSARSTMGLDPEGDSFTLQPIRSPTSIRTSAPEDVSFGEWKEGDDVPRYEDHVDEFAHSEPPDDFVHLPRITPSRSSDSISKRPHHHAFGNPSVVNIPRPPRMSGLPDEDPRITCEDLPTVARPWRPLRRNRTRPVP